MLQYKQWKGGFIKPLISLLTLLTLATPSVNKVNQRISSMPPSPTTTQIACHNKTWEDSHLTTIENHRVHKKLAPFLQAMLTNARQSYARLAINSAYRSCSQQTELRQLACGYGSYNILTRPAEECSPPTEPAKQSLHNEGLAVDFRCEGHSYFASSPCYNWLQQNAAASYLINRPGEPWHWSTTGH